MTSRLPAFVVTVNVVAHCQASGFHRVVLTCHGSELLTPYTAEDWSGLHPHADDVLRCLVADLAAKAPELMTWGRTVPYWAARLRILLGDDGFRGLIDALRSEGADVAALVDSETTVCAARSSPPQ